MRCLSPISDGGAAIPNACHISPATCGELSLRARVRRHALQGGHGGALEKRLGDSCA
jgi:hypothetical protein